MSLDKAALRELNLYPRWVLREVPVETEMAPVEPIVAEVAVPASEPPPVREEVVERTVELAPPTDPCADLGWDELKAKVKDCTACKLRAGCTQTVFGVGDTQADWLFVGEGPGADEDLKGEPFVGQAGRLLDAMLDALGLTREPGPPERQVYIANTLKCRPPGNRNPLPEEMARCEPFLVRQIQLVRPRILLAMGRFAVQALLRTDEPIGRLRGRVHRYQGVPLVVTYHPAYLLRQPTDKAKAWDDLCLAAEVIEGQGAAGA